MSDELDTEQLKWVVLMVLSSQPDQEHAFARLEDLWSPHPRACHIEQLRRLPVDLIRPRLVRGFSFLEDSRRDG